MADRVQVIIYLWALLDKLNNFTFGIKAVLWLESTILDGWPASRPVCRPAWRSWKQAGAELGQAQPWLGSRYRQARIAAIQTQTVLDKTAKVGYMYFTEVGL